MMEYLTADKAEELAGKRLDRRRKYFVWDDEVCVEEKFTHVCSGCSDDSEYSLSLTGSGCHECGYTGKRRESFPLPVKMINHITG